MMVLNYLIALAKGPGFIATISMLLALGCGLIALVAIWRGLASDKARSTLQ